jgi:hypothetical protein
MTAVLVGLLQVAVVAAVACPVVHWVVPIVLRAAVGILEETVGAVASLLLLPEYWVSTAIRARGGCPPQLAHEFGGAVAGTATHLQRFVRRVCLGLSRAARAVQPVVVAVVAGGLMAINLLT